MELTKVSH